MNLGLPTARGVRPLMRFVRGLAVSCVKRAGRTTVSVVGHENKGETMTAISPSQPARRLFGKMVAYAESDLHLTLSQTIALSVDLMRSGGDGTASSAVTELVRMEWIGPAPDGGWLLH